MLVVPPWAGDSYGIDPLAPTTWPAEDSEHAAPVAGPTTHTAHSRVSSAKRLAGFWVKARRASDTDHLENICEVILSTLRQGFQSLLKSERLSLCLGSTDL